MKPNERIKQGLLRRGWFWVLVSVALLFIIATLSANFIIGKVIERELISNGARDASVEQIRLHPFAGLLIVDSLHVIQQNIESLEIGTIHVQFRLRSLLRGNIEIKGITIRDLRYGFTLEPSKKNIFNGIGLLTLNIRDEKDNVSNWNMSLESLRIMDSRIRLIHGDEAIDLAIEKIEASGIGSMTETGELGLDVKATVNDSPFRATLAMQLRDNEATLSGSTKITALEIQPIIDLLTDEHDAITGILHVDADLEVVLNAEGVFRLTENGTMKLSGVTLKTEDMVLDVGEIKLMGVVDASRSKHGPVELLYDGQAHISPARLHANKDDRYAGFTAMSWNGKTRIMSNENEREYNIIGSTRVGGLYFNSDSFKCAAGAVHWNGDAKIATSSGEGMKPRTRGNLSFVEASFEKREPEQARIYIENITVPGLSINDVTDIAVSGMSAANVKLFRDTEKPLLSLEKLSTGNFLVTDFKEFQLDHIGIKDLSLQKEHSRLDVSHTVLHKTSFEPLKELRTAKIQIDGFEFKNNSSGKNELSCTVEEFVADNAILTEGKELTTRDFSLQSVDFQTGPHHIYLSSSRARNAHMLGTDHITLSLLDVDSLVLLQSTDKRVLKDMPSSFPLTLSKLQLMNIELNELHDVHLENAFVSGLTSIFRRSRQKPLSIGGIYKQPKEQTREQGITFSLDRLVLQQNCSIIFIDETVDPRARFDVQFKHLDLQGIGSRDKNVPINFTSRIISGSYAEITAEGIIQRNYSPPNLDIALYVNGFGLQELSPYAREYLGYRIERGKLFLDGNLSIDEGKLKGKGTLTLKNTVMIPEETEKSKQALSIYARPIENAFKILSDKNNTLTIEIPISGDVNKPNFDLSKVARTAVTKAIRTAITLTLGIALWPYSGVYVAADYAASSLTTAELEPVYFNTGKSQLSDSMKRYLKQVASFLDEHPHVDMTLCSVSTAADQKRFSNEKRLNRLSEKRAIEVKEHLVNSGGIDPDRLFHSLPEFDPSIHTAGFVELKI